MKILQVINTGLGTIPAVVTGDPLRDSQADCGMLDIATNVRNELFPAEQHEIWAFGWDQETPDVECLDLMSKMEEFAPDWTIFHAHSFGNSFALYFTQWAAKNRPGKVVVDDYFGYDPCENPKFGLKVWAPDPTACRRYTTYFQRGGRPFMVSGSPFSLPKGGVGVNVDVTGWTSPTLAHIDIFGWTGIINDQRVRQSVYQNLRQSRQFVKVAA